MLNSTHTSGEVSIYNFKEKTIEKENVFAWVSLLMLAN